LLEETNLILPVGDWVLNEACCQIRRWLDEGLTVPPVAVNLSVRQVQQQSLQSAVLRLLRKTRVPTQLLEFEITESLLMNDPAAAERVLRTLSEAGVKLSVDDFGTGYSSLAYLKRFPLDALKIDRDFIRDLRTDPEDAAITLAIINLAHSLDLRVVAEGVENEDQLDFLAAHGCDEIQGFYFSRALAVAECEVLLRQGRRL
jgi:EAL domain-containing protein (putative c-di-GMP-specific phosphodiesterase class I)